MLLNNLNGSINDKCVDMANVQVFVYESSHSSWTELFFKLEVLQENECWGNSELIQCHTEIDIGAFWRNSECEYDWQCISLMVEIRILSWPSDPVDSKTTCLLRFITMLRKDEWRERCNYKMGRSSGRIQNVSFLQRIAGNRWRSNWIRVEYSPRILVIADSSENPGWFARAAHKNLKNLQTGSSSCQCSTTSIGQEKEKI